MPGNDQARVALNRRKRVRIFGLFGLALVCVGAAVLTKYFWFSLPIGNGPAGPWVGPERFQKVWTSRPVLLLGVGDSVTAGFGASGGHSYFDMLVTNPSEEIDPMKGICLSKTLPNLRTRNLAVSGTTSQQHESLQFSKLEVQSPDVLGIVVMTSGGNDLIHNYGHTPPREGAMYGATIEQARPWIEAFDLRLGAMIDRLVRCFPGGCHIFLANIYDPTDDIGDTQRAGLPPWSDGLKILNAYNRIIARYAQDRSNVHLVNIHDEFLGHGIHCTQPWQKHYCLSDPHYWYYMNLEDPNDRGYDAIRRVFLLAIADVFTAMSTRPATSAAA